MNKKIRYAVVGLGHIAQTTVLPAFIISSHKQVSRTGHSHWQF